MASSGPTAKILFVLDLDYTHFNSSIESEAIWLGKESDWHAFYNKCWEIAYYSGVELLFAVVTNKPAFDDIAEIAARSFKPLLSVGNHFMYTHDNQTDWCLVSHGGTLKYECLSYNKTSNCTHLNAFSHFVVVPKKEKAPFILEIAAVHGIPAQNCLLLDDMPGVLLNATLNGIHTVGFEEFCPDLIDNKCKLGESEFVERILAEKRQLILSKLEEMLKSILAPTSMKVDSASEQCDFYDPKDPKDPKDCLHSWRSYRLFTADSAAGPSEPVVEPTTSQKDIVYKPFSFFGI